MSPKPKFKVQPSSAKGDFYVVNECCTRVVCRRRWLPT